MNLLSLFLMSVVPLASVGQLQSPSSQPPSGVPSPKTTEVMVILTAKTGVTRQQIMNIMPAEIRATVKLYLDGKIDQWYSLQNRVGVAFILNVTDIAAAHDMLEKLPLGQAHLMSFELIPLGPLNPLRQLQGMSTGPQ